MHLRHIANGPGRRRGIVLLIVLAMLTLFAIAGLTFVLYAEAAAESARINRDAESFTAVSGPDMDPNQAFNLFLGQLIYGVDDTNGVYSGLRGHSLAETMYGSYDANGTIPSDAPYDGTGRLHETVAGTDGYNMVNYTYYASDGFLRDPSRLGTRANTAAARGQYTGGQNAPYTYPDLNSMFLASINSANGQVNTPSYLRPWLFNNDWTSAQGKYKTLRPRPQEMGPGFPMPSANGCDVVNLSGVSTQPDSIWIDIGAPELITAAGLRYKMLVAPLVLDLDSRVNLNAVGNILQNGNLHASNQGWGPWEVNMGKVLNATTAPNEWQNVFLGNPSTGAGPPTPLYGRYGADRLPSATFTLKGPAPHAYAQADLNGTLDPAPSTLTGLYTLPTVAGGANPSYFPSFPTGYGNGGTLETTNSAGTPIHPFFFNPFTPAGDDRLLPLSAHASLLWAGIAASPGSDLVRLSPTNFSQTDATSLKRINQTTLLSMELDRPGAAPYIYDQSTFAYNVAYGVTAPGQGSYTASGVATPPTFPTVSPLPRQAVPTIPGEFDPTTWRSVLAATLSRTDLDRLLTPYTGANANPTQAAADRQQFAMDIFTRLLAVTGMSAAYNNLNSASTTPPTAAQYATLRWLAQLSANVVDYIDTDDVMTAFQWAGAPGAPQAAPQAPDTGYVFGTELPKLVVNEVYLEYDNDPADPGMIANPTPPPPMIQAATKPYQMNVWAELLNPLPSTADPNAPPNGIQLNNDAKLVDGSGNPLYQLVITSPNKDLRNAANLAGDPDGATPGAPPFATQPYPYTSPASYNSAATGGQVLGVVKSWGGVSTVTPVGTTQSITPAANANQGFLVIGPANPGLFGGTTPQPAGSQTQIQTSITAATGMMYTVPTTDASADKPVPPTVLLQRLANPNQPFNATSNPYITVDYVDMQQVQSATSKTVVNDVRGYNAKGQNPNWTANSNYVQNPNNRFSFGRNQPYAAVATTWQQQTAPASPALTASQPTTTFFAVNTAPASGAPPDWLVHLDRPLISPIELMNVSGFKPHELTQQFYKDASGNFQHLAPWTNQAFLLYRLLEFVKTSNATPGLVAGGRVPGKVNINTLDANDVEVFRALCDAEPGNSFYNPAPAPATSDDFVNQVFQALVTARTPGGTPGSGDKPFWGMAAGVDTGDTQYPAGLGIANTLLNTTLTNGASPYNGVTHPYQKLELLNKLFNNLTTRSNVFAVWLTVGFFQVTNDTVQPMQLGAEVNAAQGKNIRHHMFAIVDRTQIQTFSTTTPFTTTAAVAAGNNQPLNLPTMTPADSRTGRTWQIQAGSWLVYDPGLTTEETVLVQAGNTANFTQAHVKGATVISRGHPGPWLNYNPQQDNQVVPYSVIID